MSKPTYPAKYRERLVDLVRSGRSPEKLAEEFEPCAATIRSWVKQADLDDGRRKDGLTSEERAELQHLRRENRQLREERDILKKAAAWFAKEADGASSKRSGS
jgi:transposase